MKIKRIAALASLGAILSTAVPAMAAGPTATGTVTVKWNTQSVAAITMYTQTTASKTHTLPAANDIFWAGNSSLTSGCAGTINTASAGKDTTGAGTVDFGNVTPDSAQYTNCLEINAIDAFVTTNDATGYTVAVSETGATQNYDAAANGTLLCVYPNGAYANNLAWTASARAAAVANTSTTACSGGGFLVATSAPGTSLLTSAAATGGTELNGDMELTLGPNPPTGAQTVTVTYTVTGN